MNDHPINAVREARRKISEQFGHDPRKLVEHYRRLQERHRDRMISQDDVSPGATSGLPTRADRARNTE